MAEPGMTGSTGLGKRDSRKRGMGEFGGEGQKKNGETRKKESRGGGRPDERQIRADRKAEGEKF